MFEVKVVRLVDKAAEKVRGFALKSLNRRSIRNIAKYQKQESYISKSREFLDQMAEHIEVEYQIRDAEITSAYKSLRDDN